MSDWIKTAKVGDKVVCLKYTVFIANNRGFRGFKAGEFLTIREIRMLDASGNLPEPEPFLSFDERSEFHFGHYRGFRPVTPRNTDISVFTDMLKGVREPVEETV
jgi:hypothetical protein